MATHETRAEHGGSQDPIEAVTPLIPIVLPVVGALLMFLLAFIAIYLA
jgi:hypothetical protein